MRVEAADAVPARPAPRPEQTDDGDHRANARVPGSPMRLKIWKGLAWVEESALSAAPGPERDLARLYRDEAPRLRRRLGRRFQPDRAADIVQSAFERVLGLGSERMQQLASPQAYLTRVADNLAHNEARSAGRRGEGRHIPIEDCQLASSDPVLSLEARDMLRRIEVAIDGLPDRTREIFMAHRFECLTYPEIAARMGLGTKAVEKHMSAALRALHEAAGYRT